MPPSPSKSPFWQKQPDSEAIVQPHNLCPPCQQLCDGSSLLHTLPAVYERWDSDSRQGRPAQITDECRERYPLHTFSDFEACYLEGLCHLCAIIRSELDEEVGYDALTELKRVEEGLGKPADKRLVAVIRGGGKKCVNHCLLSFEVGGHEPKASMQLLMSSEPYTAPIRTLDDAQLALFTGSSASFTLAKKWLNACLSDHTACAQERASAIHTRRLPTRLVDVGLEGKSIPRLIVSDNLASATPYLTLSHSWGDASFLKLTIANIDVLMTCIPMEGASQTHRDSISATRSLGYRYIWIDSLCIIQDSAEDWRTESAQMASTYGNSICNIAAKGASSHTGCFLHRNPLIRRPCQLLQSGATESDEGVYAHPYVTASYNSYTNYYYDTSAPLLRRAWVLQERLLSPRILYFGEQEIHWECCSFQASESWPYGPPSEDHGFDEVYPLKMAFEAELKPFNDWTKDDHMGFVQELWHNGIIREYTVARLTFEKDRMVALAGIVSVIRMRTGLTYVAGLWKELLPLDLLWHKMDDVAVGRLRSSAPWAAPTWSWASMEGRIRYSFGSFRHPRDEKVQYLSRVMDCQVTPLEDQVPILGEVSQGVLTLTGYLKMADSKEELGNGTIKEGTFPRWCSLDRKIPEDEELFYFMLMRSRDNDVTRTDTGLVLARNTERGDGYMRMGIFVSSYDSKIGGIFDGTEEVIVTIY